MKRIYENMVKGGLLGAVLLLGATSCSDDHFDVKSDATGAGELTIWQNIQQNDNLSDFAQVLKKTRVMTKETDTKSVLTYSEFLDQPQMVTLWAPVNGTFDLSGYLKTLDSVSVLRGTDPVAAAKLEYTVANRFVQNHLARFNYEFAKDTVVRMMNAKNCDYSPKNGTFNGVQIVSGSKVIGSNGVLHLLSQVSPFADNIFDYLASNPDVSTVYGIINSVEKTEFWPEGSTEGAMNDNAEMIYVDSVYTNSNEILDASFAKIKSEDSIYIAVIPVNSAWSGAVEKVAPLFKYHSSYSYDWSKDENKFMKTGVNAWKINADSLQQVSTQSAIITSMYFNPTEFKGVNKKDSAAVIQHFLYADSLISTNGTVFYNKAGEGNINPMFLDAQGNLIKPVRASNGYIFPVDVYNIDPAYSFIPKIVELDAHAFNLASLTGCSSESGEVVVLTNETRIEDSVVAGVSDLRDDTYYYFKSTGGRMNINFPLRNIASGRYKISVVMLPNKAYKPRSVDANGEPKVEEPTFDVRVYDDDFKTTLNKRAQNVPVRQDAVEKIVIWEDFEIAKTYKNLPSGCESFPILQISVTAAQQKKGNFDALSIKSVVLEPVRE